MIIVHHFQLLFCAETKLWYRQKMSVQVHKCCTSSTVQRGASRAREQKGFQSSGSKVVFRSPCAHFLQLFIQCYQKSKSCWSQDIFQKEVVLLRGCIGVILLCCCVWMLPFPPTWNLIRSRWEMEDKMDKQWCYLVRNAHRNRGNPTFLYEDNFSNKTLRKHTGPSLTWAPKFVCVL